MSSEPRQFVLQARDHGCPVFEARFPVAGLDDLRALIGIDRDDDPELEGPYTLDAAKTAAVTARFGVAFDPEGREAHLWPWGDNWDSMRHFPYLIHGGYELPLLLEGKKQLADMSHAYPPHRHFNEDKFDRYVTEGILHKEVVHEPFDDRLEPYRIKDGRAFEGMRRVYYARKGEDWRIPAYRLLWDASSKSGWSEDFERMLGMLLGYEQWQNDWWIANLRKGRYRFGCFSLYRAVSAEDLAWIDAAGYRALPPTNGTALVVSSLWDPPDDDAAQRMMESTGADALVHLNVRTLPFLDLVKGHSGPDHTIPAAHVRDLNRNIEGTIEVVASKQAEAAPEPAGSHLQETRPPQ
jgi:hypothetical protein